MSNHPDYPDLVATIKPALTAIGDYASPAACFAAHAALDAGYRKPRVIETLEELEALPEHVVIREDGGRIFERSEFLAINLSYDLTRPWFSCAALSGLRTDTIRLPATVLYMPEETQQAVGRICTNEHECPTCLARPFEFCTVSDHNFGTRQVSWVHAARTPEYRDVQQPTEERCPDCDGRGGVHGFVHVRHGNGGGHNEPCPNREESDRA